MIKKHIYTSRSPVSDENNNLVMDIAAKLDAEIIKSKSGSEILSWIVPLYWKVKKGILKSKSGEIIADFKNNPLHLWTNSASFSGIIAKSKLDNHICTNKNKPDSIPYHHKFGFSSKPEGWGFCISYNDYIKMKDNEYIVEIETELNNSAYMMTGVSTINGGGNKDTYIFAAHTCHPAQAVDGLTNAALLTDIFSELKSKNLKNSYKFIFGAEYFAAAAFLNSIDDIEVKQIKGGFFLDMIGADTKLAFSTSFQADTFLDKVVEYVYKNQAEDYDRYGFREYVGNDEMFYNGHYYNIPTVILHQNFPKYYHTSGDNYDNIDFKRIDTYKKIIYDIIDILETDYIPVLKYKGPLQLSRYGLYIDCKQNLKGYEQLLTIEMLADGSKSCFKMAYDIGADYYFVKSFFDKLIEYSLADKV